MKSILTETEIQNVDSSPASNSPPYNYHLNRFQESPLCVSSNLNSNPNSETVNEDQYRPCIKYQNEKRSLLSIRCEKCQFTCSSLEMLVDHLYNTHRDSDSSNSDFEGEKSRNSISDLISPNVDENMTVYDTINPNVNSRGENQYSHLMEHFQQQEKQRKLLGHQQLQLQVNKASIPIPKVSTSNLNISSNFKPQNNFSTVSSDVRKFSVPSRTSVPFSTIVQNVSNSFSTSFVNSKLQNSFLGDDSPEAPRFNFISEAVPSKSTKFHEISIPLLSDIPSVSLSIATSSTVSKPQNQLSKIVSTLKTSRSNINIDTLSQSRIGKYKSSSKAYETQKAKTHHCLLCNKWFTSSGHLKRHSNTTLHQKVADFSSLPDLPLPRFDENVNSQDKINLSQNRYVEKSSSEMNTCKSTENVTPTRNPFNTNSFDNQYSFIPPPKSFPQFYDRFQDSTSSTTFSYNPQTMHTPPLPTATMSPMYPHFQAPHYNPTNMKNTDFDFFGDSTMNYQMPSGYYDDQKNQMWNQPKFYGDIRTSSYQFDYMRRPLGENSMTSTCDYTKSL